MKIIFKLINLFFGQIRKSNSKSAYKHIPHRDKPVHLVARRNARERKRVQAVNLAFMKLRKCVPVENRNKRLSKVKTLHRAIEYIAALDQLLKQQIVCGQNFQYNINSETINRLPVANDNVNNINLKSSNCCSAKITFNDQSKPVVHHCYLNHQANHQINNASTSSAERYHEISGTKKNLILRDLPQT